jgi:predicted HicB family RNase H-like nuclease
MDTPNPKKQTRHGKRAPGKTQTSITLSEELLARAKEAAARDGRSLSNWLEQIVKKGLPLLLIAIGRALA